jgi:NAD(P)-dependent dehydrogenase (short-subunit alcohol dehydrogenase family)
MASIVSEKIAFVTGGASGIGAAQELAQRLNSGGAKAHAIELDVRSYPSFESAVAEAVQQSGRIDYLFNNAGIGVSMIGLPSLSSTGLPWWSSRGLSISSIPEA